MKIDASNCLLLNRSTWLQVRFKLENQLPIDENKLIIGLSIQCESASAGMRALANPVSSRPW